MTEQGLLKVGIDYGNGSAAVGKVGGKDTTKGRLPTPPFTLVYNTIFPIVIQMIS